MGYPSGIVVDLNGERFIDEGADFRNHTYAKYGKEVMKQPQRTAIQIFDNKTHHMVRDEYRIREVTKASANSITELAEALDIDVDGLVNTVNAFNASCVGGEYNPSILDSVKTTGLAVPKSYWALPIDQGPFHGHVVTCGITFTFGGIRINAHAEVLDLAGNPIKGLYAAGELVGGMFYHNYPAALDCFMVQCSDG